MKGTLKLTCYEPIRLGDFSASSSMAKSTPCGSSEKYILCVNLSGPTIVSLNPEIQPIDLEIKEL